MPLTAKQQKNVEILVDQHFDDVRRSLRDKQQSTPWAKVEVRPELKQLAETHAKVLELQDRQALDALKIFNDALVSLGFSEQRPPYTLTGTQTTEYRVEGLISRIVTDEKNRLNRQAQLRFEAAWDEVDVAWRKARRDILLAALDGSDALRLIEALPTLETFLTEE